MFRHRPPRTVRWSGSLNVPFPRILRPPSGALLPRHRVPEPQGHSRLLPAYRHRKVPPGRFRRSPGGCQGDCCRRPESCISFFPPVKLCGRCSIFWLSFRCQAYSRSYSCSTAPAFCGHPVTGGRYARKPAAEAGSLRCGIFFSKDLPYCVLPDI